MAFLGNVEYKLGNDGIADYVKCPLIDDWIKDIDCLENQDVREEFIPKKYKKKKEWKQICKKCPFRDY